MKSLISFDGAADVMNNLIDKLSGVVGWIATHETPERIAVETYIEDIKKSNLDPATKAALISSAHKIIKEYRNQKDVIKIALQAASPLAKPEEIDDDWLAQFMDKVRLVSNEKFQILWGHILAEECNEPGSIPKSLLHIMEQMDKEMAESFMNVAAVSVWYEHNGEKIYSPIITGATLEDYYKDKGIQYGDLVELQSVGLLKMSFGFSDSSFVQRPEFSPIVVHYHDQKYTIPDNSTEFEVGNVVFTGSGGALCRAVFPEKIDGFFEERCISFWEKERPKE